MELQFTNLEAFLSRCPFNTYTLFDPQNLKQGAIAHHKATMYFDQGIIPVLSEDENIKVQAMIKLELSQTLSLYDSNLIEEIDFNLANIDNDAQVLRYLRLLEQKLIPILTHLKEQHSYQYIMHTKRINFEGSKISSITANPDRQPHVIFRFLAKIIAKIRAIERVLNHIESITPKHSNSERKVRGKALQAGNLFKPGIDPQAYIDILKNTDPPILNKNGEFTRGSKSKACIAAWIDQLSSFGIINEGLNDAQRAELINKAIPNLNITDRTLRSAESKVSRTYLQYEGNIHDLLCKVN